jgi:hypothetical protein
MLEQEVRAAQRGQERRLQDIEDDRILAEQRAKEEAANRSFYNLWGLLGDKFDDDEAEYTEAPCDDDAPGEAKKLEECQRIKKTYNNNWKKAYLDLALKNHPDRGGDQETFQLYNELLNDADSCRHCVNRVGRDDQRKAAIMKKRANARAEAERMQKEMQRKKQTQQMKRQTQAENPPRFFYSWQKESYENKLKARRYNKLRKEWRKYEGNKAYIFFLELFQEYAHGRYYDIFTTDQRHALYDLWTETADSRTHLFPTTWFDKWCEVCRKLDAEMEEL